MNTQTVISIIERELPNFFYQVEERPQFIGDGTYFKIMVAPTNYEINKVRGQYPQAVSLMLNPRTLELHPQVYGGNGGQCIYRKPNPDIDPKEKYLAMKSVKVPFRTPQRTEEAVEKALTKFLCNYKNLLKENIEVLTHAEYVNYKAII